MDVELNEREPAAKRPWTTPHLEVVDFGEIAGKTSPNIAEDETSTSFVT